MATPTPHDLLASNLTHNSFRLSWELEVVDGVGDVAVACEYELEHTHGATGRVSTKALTGRYIDFSSSEASGYYRVRARWKEFNWSSWSDKISVICPKLPPAQPRPPIHEVCLTKL